MIAVDPTLHLSSGFPSDEPSPRTTIDHSPSRPPLPLAKSDSHLITSPAAFLAALIAHNFDLPAVLRSFLATAPASASASPSANAQCLMPNALSASLLTFIQDPQLLADIESLKKFAALCEPLHQQHIRSTSQSALTSILSTTQDPIEKRRAATTLLRSTYSSSPPRPPRLPLPEGGGRGKGDPRSRSSSSTHQPISSSTPSSPHPSLTPHEIIDSITNQFDCADWKEPDPSLGVLAAFLSHDAAIDGVPIPVDDQGACLAALRNSRVSDCVGNIATDSKPIVHSSPDAAAATIFYRASPEGISYNITYSLSRSPSSHRPNCWLIHAITFERLPDDTDLDSSPSSSTHQLSTSSTPKQLINPSPKHQLAPALARQRQRSVGP